MSNKTIDTKQGHWILAKMGKKVLRPGGKELTQKLIQNLQINSEDDIVEFAPGLGFTASIALKSNPKTYTGIELNEEAANILRKTIIGKDREIIIGNAAESTLGDSTYSKVYGEAMHLLEPKRMIDDEGFFRTLKIAFNILTHPNERKRILAMRKIFRKYQSHLNAISIVAKKK